MNEDFSGRKWTVTVSSAEAERKMRHEQARQRQSEKKLEQELEWKKQLDAAVWRHPQGETYSVLREMAGISKSKNVKHLLDQLVQEGVAAPCEIQKQCGRKVQHYEGYKPAYNHTAVGPLHQNAAANSGASEPT